MPKRSLLARATFYFISYFKTELNPIRVKFFTLFDSIAVFIIQIISGIFRKIPYILSTYIKLVEDRRAKLVQGLFQVYFLYERFPPDIYWNDYFRRRDFLPKKTILS